MNPQNTSFIPQRPTQGKINNRSVRKIYILSYVSYILFFGALLSALGVFLYTYTLNVQMTAAQIKLTQEQGQFGQEEMESVLRLEQLINTANEKMDAHISLPRIFEAVELSALETLTLKEMTYTRLDEAPPAIVLVGESLNFNTVLFQREVLESNPVLANATFSKVEIKEVPTENGADGTESSENEEARAVVSFEIGFAVEPELVNYVPRGEEQLIQNDVEVTPQSSSQEPIQDQSQATSSIESE